ncbi:MAG: Abhydrolase family protein [Firmicutes bacterium ADurb.Bin300]|nr:MAG: Abhydrolase family protein [Firmicutes bacterium ADurb.Bin300]
MKGLLPLEKELQLMSEILPAFAYDEKEDFKAWQEKARLKLSELLGMDKFIPVKPEITVEFDRITDCFREIRFRFFSEESYSVPCHLCVPLKAEKPLPLMICLQGHSPGMYISLGETQIEKDSLLIEGDRNFAVRSVKEGVCALALEQRNFGECGGKDNKPDCYKAAMSALLIGRTTIGERVWDIMRAIDAVTEYFGGIVDKDRIGCLGNSGGGTATFYTSILEERIKLSVVSCALCSYDESIAAMHHCACNFIPHIREYFNMGDLGGLISPRKLLMVSGEKDGIFPIDGANKTFKTIKRLYTTSGVPDNCDIVTGSEGHRFYADLAWIKIHKLGF